MPDGDKQEPQAPGEGGAAGERARLGLDTDSAGRAQGAGSRHKPGPAFPCSPARCPGMAGDRRDGRDHPVGSDHGSALLVAQSRAPCHVHTPTRPSGLSKCFASGVTILPEQLELLCQHLATTTGTLAKSWVRGGEGPTWPEPGAQGVWRRGQGWQLGHSRSVGVGGCGHYLRAGGGSWGCGLGRRLPQTGRPNGPGQGGGEGWREGTHVRRFQDRG